MLNWNFMEFTMELNALISIKLLDKENKNNYEDYNVEKVKRIKKKQYMIIL